ncbi:unnamed protein product [Prorocentrum cordatum]|uniref:MIF4G domain-containing protein n=1 Tax=Prorocentrum cordatum TaxID=2364126 RepID=A0ABN9Q8G7_9DINO|nr:unnamed protein product [Polarella glacialis]
MTTTTTTTTTGDLGFLFAAQVARRASGKLATLTTPPRSPASTCASASELSSSPTSWAMQQKLRRQNSGETPKVQDGFAPESPVSDAEIRRRVKSILNKLTPEKFDKLLVQMAQCGACTCSHLDTLAQAIFQEASVQHNFAGMYADLCACLVVSFGEGGCFLGNALLNQCWELFRESLQPEPEALDSEGPEAGPRLRAAPLEAMVLAAETASMLEQMQTNLHLSLAAAIDTRTLYKDTLKNATPQIHETGQTDMIQFPSGDEARRFRLRYSQQGSQWTNKRDGKTTESRARGDLSPEGRARNRTIAKDRQPYRAHAQDAPVLNENFYIRANGFKGVMSLTNEQDIWPIIHLLCVTDDHYHSEADGVELRQWGLDVAAVNAILAATDKNPGAI